MKLQSNPRLPLPNDPTRLLTARLYEIFRDWSAILNRSAMWDSEGTTAPTTGAWSQGDKVKNSSPSEAGTAGSKYVVIGWVCTVAGSPGTWVDMRCLTGN